MHQQPHSVFRFQKHIVKPIKLFKDTVSPELLWGMLLVLMFLALPKLALAEDTLNSGDTAWLLTATALVLFMTIPGLALFYGGLVRAKNVLSLLMQCFTLTGLITVIWIVIGYSIAFDTTGMMSKVTNGHSFVGGLGKVFLQGVNADSLSGTIPETVFICFQMTFAIITPALIAGAFAERMKFSAMLWFMGIWSIIVYAPICHMAWAGDGSYFGDIVGALDFAGGTVVHVNAGVAALVAALMIGKRYGYPETPMPPPQPDPHGHWCLHALGRLVRFQCPAVLWQLTVQREWRCLVTQISTGTAALAWMFIEWIKYKKPSVLGIVTGAVAGLVAITPASGSVGPMGALVIGLVSGVICFWGATTLKHKLGYDDSLDAFGVHGIGGIVGCLLTGIFAAEGLGGMGMDKSIGSQLWSQFVSLIVTILWSGILSFIILKAVDRAVGLRVKYNDEQEGLDLALHNERGYNL